MMGPGSLHASIVAGGRELSSYPDRCCLQMERRTVGGESGEGALREVTTILEALAGEDSEFEASATLKFARPPYELATDHALPRLLMRAVESLGSATRTTAMSCWTDAAVLGAAGIASVLFGPGGAGLHSREEYVTVSDVLACRDALSHLVQDWC